MKRKEDIKRRTLLTALAGATSFASSSLATDRRRPDKIVFAFNGQMISVTLIDNPTSRALMKLLPLSLTIEDYAHNEKIIRLPQRLPTTGNVPFAQEAPGDLCYFAPWGNLAFFYAAYEYSSGLTRIGKIDGNIAPLLNKGTYKLTIR
ncbi:cyclophilin-like fold protein [Asticcacaulis excentricus]|uniref:Cyclophilin-like domain-containing protein n=1 Tax=Asticcacaulis excentricus (strain ATCC 15261 / DSM 4724 / KCTC 12464 / NCIMB 9791 / VKM B-1370 / CB 48) TaxID=573065 RepID=E8RLI0_ASTEC|nr:cyclophilin-like fold protein [Asticcacaulis excentricus]ADU13724.1 hypothetical protein Astex_2062 [Asticcacaulis excentricus CB 48]